MDKLNVCFAGIGSIARRHIRNLRSVCAERGIELELDAYRRTNAGCEGVDNVYCLIDDVPDDYDIIFITNPTSMHLDTLRAFHDKGRHFFIEKPLVAVDQLDKAKPFRTKDDSIYYVAAPLRYNAVIRWIRNNVDPDDVISVRSISSSYLPDWRPGTDYRETYSAHRELGGGVSIDLIHEWDYITYLFGWPDKVCSMIGKKSALEIDSDDYAIYLAEYRDKIAEIHLDYFGRKPIREVQLFTKDDTIIGDLIGNKLRFMAGDEEIDFNEERDDYQKREMIHFLDMISGKCEPEDGFRHAIKVIELTQGI
jgi:predicted dehydrogenase